MKLKIYLAIFSLLLLALPACSDEPVIPASDAAAEGQVKYRFMAEIDEIPLSRVIIEPYDHGHGDEHTHDIVLHWEEGDVVELEATGTSLKYEFVARKYVCHADGTIERFTDSTVLASDDREVIFFEYSGSADIEHADDFSGTATCRPVELGEGTPLVQMEPNSALHLHHCELLTARLKNIDLTSPVAAWTSAGVQQPVVFSHAGEYAYLKIEVNRFRYPIGNNGVIFVYDMDEESTDEEYRCREYYTPLASMNFDSSESNFINVPEKGSGSYPDSDFDTYTGHYLRGSEIECDFYVPVPATTIEAGHYLAAVVQCGSTGDLYVFEKKVPFRMELRAGNLYTLDYTDRQPEYAMCVVPNLTYIRSTYLGQNFEGAGASAPYYNLKGEEVSLANNTPHHSSRFSEQDVAQLGDDYLTADEVKTMRNNHGAFYMVSSSWDNPVDGTEMVAISSIKKAYWERWEEVDNDGGAWKLYKDGYAVDASGNRYTSGNRKMVLTDIDTIIDYNRTKDYMKNITKGVITRESLYHMGASHNCYEYVLKDRFDPVIHQRKTSLLWRAPYGRDVIIPLSKVNNNISVQVRNKVVIITVPNGHSIALPLLLEYYEDKPVRSTRFDGAGATTGVWRQRLQSNLSTARFFGCRSIRSFGGNNPTYFQMTCAGVTYSSGKFSTTFNQTSVFDIALPVLPVFRWHKIANSNRLIFWD